jgi:hypothetical protein
MPKESFGIPADATKRYVYYGLYHGPEDNRMRRNIALVNDELKGSGKTLDDFLAEQLVSAFNAGRSEAVLLDIGSGTGELFASFIQDYSMGKKSRAFLRTNPQFKVQMIGLTDSPTASHHLKVMPIELLDGMLKEDSKRLQEQVEIRNVYYSLARGQSLNDFLKTQGIETIDLAVAIQSLRYLGPKVFEEVLQTVVSKMPRGGKLIASGVSESVPGYDGACGDEFYVPEKLIHPDRATRRSMLYWKGIEPGAAEKSDPEAEKEALEAAWQTYKRLGVLTDERIEEVRQSFEQTAGITDRARFAWLAHTTLEEAFVKLKSRQKINATNVKSQKLMEVRDVVLQYFVPPKEGNIGIIVTKK